MIISRHLIDQLIAQAIAEAPRECCGMIGCRWRLGFETPGGRMEVSVGTREAVRLYPAVNVAESETRYEIGGLQQMVILDEIKDSGLEVGAIYHSHTHGPPVPSHTDVVTAHHSDVLYLIIGRKVLSTDLTVRAFRIRDGLVTEERLQIV